MERADIQKLLGGYATGTLTPDEQQALFEAALDDQELFDALVKEQPLRALLQDSAAKAQLLASLDNTLQPWYRRFWRPMALVAAAAILLGVGIYVNRPPPPKPSLPLLAEFKPEAPPAPPIAKPAPPETVPSAPVLAARKPRVVPRKQEATVAAVDRSHAAASEAMPIAPKVVPAPAAPARNISETSGQLQSAFLDNGAKPIPLQSARALFFAQQAKDAGALRDQEETLKQALQQQKVQQQQAGAPQADAQVNVQSFKAVSGQLRTQGAAHLGVNWTVLRQRAGGEFANSEPDQLLAGDSVKLRLIPNDDGFVSVWEGGTPVLSGVRVERLKPFFTPLVTSDRAGDKILRIQFTRTLPSPALLRTSAEQQSATDSRDHSTYILTGNPATPVSVTIPLIFR